MSITALFVKFTNGEIVHSKVRSINRKHSTVTLACGKDFPSILTLIGDTGAMPQQAFRNSKNLIYNEAGEDWYVLATDKALAEIRAVERNLYQEKFIYRSSENDSQSQQHAMIIELSR